MKNKTVFFKEDGNTDDLFLLIKGLTSSEKSYIKKMSKRHAAQNESLHLKLFKLINENEIADENQLCTALQIENKVHFSILKNYLHKDILDTLVFQRRNNSVDIELHFMEYQIRILHEKRLLQLAGKLCKKAIALARKYEKYHFLILLIQLENQVLEYKDYKQYKADTYFQNLRLAINSQHQLAENKFLYEKVRRLTYRTWLPITEEELSEINKIKLLLDTPELSNNEQPVVSLFYLNSLALCQYMLHEHTSCLETCRKIYNLWKTSPHLINEYSLLFLNSVNTSCYNHFLLQNIQNVRENLMAYRKMVEAYLKNGNCGKYFEVISFNTDLKIYLKTAQFDQLGELIKSKSAVVLSYSSNVLPPADHLSILCSVSIAYFVLEQWEDAERLMLIIKEQNRNINREDILYFSLVFYLIILYEQKEWYRLDIALEAAYHFLYSRGKLRPFERELMLFLGHLSSAGVKYNPSELIKRFLEDLEKYKDDQDKKLYFLYFNYYGWLESKVMNVRYMDYIQSKIRQSA